MRATVCTCIYVCKVVSTILESSDQGRHMISRHERIHENALDKESIIISASIVLVSVDFDFSTRVQIKRPHIHI